MKTIQPNFSIIIPTFNRAHLLISALHSILTQHEASFEIIVVDDGSQDDTGQRTKELGDDRIRYIKTENRERGAARNAGLAISTGMYINYFDSDDTLERCLQELSQFLEKNRFPDVVFGQIENVSEEGTSIEIVKPGYLEFKKSILHNNFLACGSVFIRRDVALQHLFSEDRKLSGTEDWELWLRLYAVHDFVPFPQVVFKQVHHPSRSLTNAPAERVAERENAFIDHINKNRHILSSRFSKGECNLLIADRYTLMALAQCESDTKKMVVRYLVSALKNSASVITRKRFWAVLKKLIAD